MRTVLFPNFLSDRRDYLQAVSFWQHQWTEVDVIAKAVYGWRTPWLNVGPEALQDGNPIFTAVSDSQKKGLRIIQAPPQRPGLDIALWLDTFGGGPKDPNTVTELVIACVLSEMTAAQAFRHMNDWIMAGSNRTIRARVREHAIVVDERALNALAA